MPTIRRILLCNSTQSQTTQERVSGVWTSFCSLCFKMTFRVNLVKLNRGSVSLQHRRTAGWALKSRRWFPVRPGKSKFCRKKIVDPESKLRAGGESGSSIMRWQTWNHLYQTHKHKKIWAPDSWTLNYSDSHKLPALSFLSFVQRRASSRSRQREWKPVHQFPNRGTDQSGW